MSIVTDVSDVMNVLVLAGTTEATELAGVLDARGVRVVSSLAGATAKPSSRAGLVRRGGFGGVEGLVEYLDTASIDAIVDATHPFAAVMPHHVAAAAAATGIRSCRLMRPPWRPGSADQWIEVGDLDEAAAALAAMGARRPLLTVGRQSMGPFAGSDAHVVVRCIEAPETLPPDHLLLLERGPFFLEDERALLATHGIDAVVAKNSGGSATEAKLIAARERGIPVILVARPPSPDVTVVHDVDHAVAWVTGAPYDRGV